MIRWTWAMIDRPEQDLEESARFWSTVTGLARSEPLGDRNELVKLLPREGEPWLILQSLLDGAGRAHLDFVVEDVRATTAASTRLGATLEADHGDWVVLLSPGSMPFCLFPWSDEGSGGATERAFQEPSGARSLLDQVCIDIPPDVYDDEVDFWADLTGWEVRRNESEFTRLTPPPGLPVQILLQRLDEARPISAHLDLACSDRHTTSAWHETEGARVVKEFPHWIVMEDPAGSTYCLTERDPG